MYSEVPKDREIKNASSIRTRTPRFGNRSATNISQGNQILISADTKYIGKRQFFTSLYLNLKIMRFLKGDLQPIPKCPLYYMFYVSENKSALFTNILYEGYYAPPGYTMDKFSVAPEVNK